MATDTPFDFNQPGFPGNSSAGFEGAPRQRPGGLTAVCVIAIVLGGLGLCSSLFGLAAIAFQDKIEKFTMQQPQMPTMPQGAPNGALKQQLEMQQKMQKMQKAMQEKTMEVGHRYRGINIGTTLLNLLFAASLLIGGIMAMKLNPAGRTFLVAVFVAVIVFEVVRVGITVSMQLDIAAAMSSAFKDVANDQAITVFATAMKFGTYVGMAFGIGLALAQVVFYVIGASYLGRANIRRLFEPAAIDQM
jgi:hypothetical protein